MSIIVQRIRCVVTMRWSVVRIVTEVWRECLGWRTAVTLIAISKKQQSAGTCSVLNLILHVWKKK